MDKHIKDFIKGTIVTGLADYVGMYIVLSHDIVNLTIAVIVTALLGGLFNTLLNHFYKK